MEGFNLNVTILNPEEAVRLFEYWGKASCVCYDTETETPEKVGKHCFNSGHFSGSRARYILFKVEGCPRLTIDQAVRHEVGVMKNVESFRYVNQDSFVYEVPKEIMDNEELLTKYHNHMMSTLQLYNEIQEYVFNKTASHERANEQARHVLPISTHADFVIGMTVEALIHFENSRLCIRAEDKIRELAIMMKNATLELLPELKDRLVPNCQALLWCPEGKASCHAYPTKKELKSMIEDYKKMISEVKQHE
jgi:thymidylate synthase (FAD)